MRAAQEYDNWGCQLRRTGAFGINWNRNWKELATNLTLGKGKGKGPKFACKMWGKDGEIWIQIKVRNRRQSQGFYPTETEAHKWVHLAITRVQSALRWMECVFLESRNLRPAFALWKIFNYKAHIAWAKGSGYRKVHWLPVRLDGSVSCRSYFTYLAKNWK